MTSSDTVEKLVGINQTLVENAGRNCEEATTAKDVLDIAINNWVNTISGVARICEQIQDNAVRRPRRFSKATWAKIIDAQQGLSISIVELVRCSLRLQAIYGDDVARFIADIGKLVPPRPAILKKANRYEVPVLPADIIKMAMTRRPKTLVVYCNGRLSTAAWSSASGHTRLHGANGDPNLLLAAFHYLMHTSDLCYTCSAKYLVEYLSDIGIDNSWSYRHGHQSEIAAEDDWNWKHKSSYRYVQKSK